MTQLSIESAGEVARPDSVIPESLVRVFLALPVDRPFTSAEALELGAVYRVLRLFVQHGLLAHPIRGVYVSPSLPDTLELRLTILKLVVPK